MNRLLKVDGNALMRRGIRQEEVARPQPSRKPMNFSRIAQNTAAVLFYIALALSLILTGIILFSVGTNRKSDISPVETMQAPARKVAEPLPELISFEVKKDGRIIVHPSKKKEINNHIVEEFYWHGDYIVYVDNTLTKETFDEACKRLDNE